MFPIPVNFDPRRKQQQKLLEIGTRLRNAREERQISLETIAARTSIPVRLLEAIESGDADSLPEPVYIRWLIQQFANTLELDGEELAKRFPVGSGSPVDLPRFSISLPSFQPRPIHLYFLYLTLVVGSVYTVSRALDNSVLRADRLPPPSLPSGQTADRPRSNPVRPVVATPNANRAVVVEIKVKDDCWVKVIADGKTQFEGMLTRGNHRIWQADRALTVRAGNAGGVYVAVNKANAKQLGQPGKVEEVTYTATN
jgi:cytoskeletal protein RodZ